MRVAASETSHVLRHITLSLPRGEQKRQNPPSREEYDRTPGTPLDHRGTSDCPVLNAIGERAVYNPADSVDGSERLVSRSDLVHLCGPSVSGGIGFLIPEDD